MLHLGHSGISTNGGGTIQGFNPCGGSKLVWQLFDELRRGIAFPGIVRDDSSRFAIAQSRGLAVYSFSVVVPEPTFIEWKNRLDLEIAKSQYTYGFPDGDGE